MKPDRSITDTARRTLPLIAEFCWPFTSRGPSPCLLQGGITIGRGIVSPGHLLKGDKMTLPYEEKLALTNTRDFLRELLSKKGRITKLWLRTEAGRLLKHYPMEHRVDDYFKDEK